MAPGLLAAASTAVLAAAAAVVLHVAFNCPIQPLPSPRRPPSPYPPNNYLQVSRLIGSPLAMILLPIELSYAVHVNLGGRRGWRSWGKGGWPGRRTCTWTRRPAGRCTRRRGTGGCRGCTPTGRGRNGGSSVAPGCSGSSPPPTAVCLSATRKRYANAAAEASDGTVYFSDLSSRFGFDSWFLGLIEARPGGRLLRYDPRTGEASVVLDSLGFANGVALSKDEDFVAVCDTLWFRCMKLWLKGDKAGQSETLVDNLPGCPDNIHLAPDGSFWIALQQLSSPLLDLAGGWSVAKRVLASFPALVERAKAGLRPRAMVAKVSEDGRIVRLLDDSEGKVLGLVTSATEFDGDLYVGSLAADFVGIMSLVQLGQQGQDAVSS